MVFLRQRWFVALVVVCVVAISTYVLLPRDPPGYCREQKRVISDKEFIELAIRRVAGDMAIDGSEDSIRSYHANHPECCVVDTRGAKNGVIEVGLRFDSSERAVRLGAGKRREQNITMDVCGSVLNFSGTDIDQ